MKGEPTTFAGLYRAETDELFISLNFRHKKTRFKRVVSFYVFQWLREPDLNRRPSGYEPDELPGCSIPRLLF